MLDPTTQFSSKLLSIDHKIDSINSINNSQSTPPIFDYNLFKENLEKKISKEKSPLLLDYISKLAWLKKTKTNKNNFLIPLFQLSENPSKDLLKLWPQTWTGFEVTEKFKVFSPIAKQGFTSIQKLFFSTKKTVIMWRNGILNHDSGCDIYVAFNNSINLSVRIIDHGKQLNLKNTSHEEFARIIYMEYFLAIKDMLRKYGVTCQFTNKNFNSQGVVHYESSFSENFFQKYFQVGHRYSENNMECADCSIDFDLYNSLNDSCNSIYPMCAENYSNISKLRNNKDKVYDSISCMSLDQLKFLEVNFISVAMSDITEFEIIIRVLPK